MKKIPSLNCLVALGLLFVPFHSAKGANFTVVMGPSFNLTFTPASLAVNQGDTVTWTNAAPIAHTSTSGTVPGGIQTPDGLWNSGTEGANGTFSVTFNNFATNRYPYYCAIHGAIMVGSVTVTNAVPQPPPVLESAVSTPSQFQFTIDGLIGQKYSIQFSPDLISWSAISTNLALSVRSNVTDPSGTNAAGGFYRVLEIQ